MCAHNIIPRQDVAHNITLLHTTKVLFGQGWHRFLFLGDNKETEKDLCQWWQRVRREDRDVFFVSDDNNVLWCMWLPNQYMMTCPTDDFYILHSRPPEACCACYCSYFWCQVPLCNVLHKGIAHRIVMVVAKNIGMVPSWTWLWSC